MLDLEKLELSENLIDEIMDNSFIISNCPVFIRSDGELISILTDQLIEGLYYDDPEEIEFYDNSEDTDYWEFYDNFNLDEYLKDYLGIDLKNDSEFQVIRKLENYNMVRYWGYKNNYSQVPFMDVAEKDYNNLLQKIIKEVKAKKVVEND